MIISRVTYLSLIFQVFSNFPSGIIPNFNETVNTSCWTKFRLKWRGHAESAEFPIGNSAPTSTKILTIRRKKRNFWMSFGAKLKFNIGRLTETQRWANETDEHQLTLICRTICVGYFSSSCSVATAFPLKRSIWLPGGNRPWCCCHLSDWPNKAKSLLGGATFTSCANAWAIAALRFSLLLPSAYACGREITEDDWTSYTKKNWPL